MWEFKNFDDAYDAYDALFSFLILAVIEKQKNSS